MWLDHIGNFKDANVDLTNNNLTLFKETVFGPMLRQMASGKGFINMSKGSMLYLPFSFDLSLFNFQMKSIAAWEAFVIWPGLGATMLPVSL